jgi:hypothetical protein
MAERARAEARYRILLSEFIDLLQSVQTVRRVLEQRIESGGRIGLGSILYDNIGSRMMSVKNAIIERNQLRDEIGINEANRIDRASAREIYTGLVRVLMQSRESDQEFRENLEQARARARENPEDFAARSLITELETRLRLSEVNIIPISEEINRLRRDVIGEEADRIDQEVAAALLAERARINQLRYRNLRTKLTQARQSEQARRRSLAEAEQAREISADGPIISQLPPIDYLQHILRLAEENIINISAEINQLRGVIGEEEADRIDQEGADEQLAEQQRLQQLADQQRLQQMADQQRLQQLADQQRLQQRSQQRLQRRPQQREQQMVQNRNMNSYKFKITNTKNKTEEEQQTIKIKHPIFQILETTITNANIIDGYKLCIFSII